MPRLFVALRPPPIIRQRLLGLARGIPGARWQDDDQLHLTLRFVGEVDRPVAEDLAASLAAVHATTPTVRLAGVGAFRNRGHAHALWAGLDPAAPLKALAAKVDHACIRAGLEPERRGYLPHLTLARFSRGAGTAPEIEHWLGENAGLASEPFPMTHLILYQSILGREGARYEPVARWPLAGTMEGQGS